MKKYLLSLLGLFVGFISFCSAEIVCLDSDSESYVDCPIACDFTGENWSSLFINEVQHQGSSLINITIPSEFSWDYTGDEEELNVYINGYNVDSQYIEGIIDNQKSFPNEFDLNSIVSVLLPLFVPGIVVILFIYVVFKLLKKIF